MNLIFCGNSRAGKSTAIRRVLRKCNAPIYGFWTEKLPPDADGRSRVYMHGCQEALSYNASHLIGISQERGAIGFPEVFDCLGVQLLSNIPEGSLVLMDEIGIMERDATQFQAAIFRILDGNYKVLAAVRNRSTELLDAIRKHPKSKCIPAELLHSFELDSK